MDHVGSPDTVWIDQSHSFSLSTLKGALQLVVTKARFTAAYSPQSNSRAKRMVQTIKVISRA